MVRGDDFETRMQLLDILANTEEPGLRLFLDYHGCWLIWSWMVDEENMDPDAVQKLRKKLLELLQRLPIPHINMLEDSRVLRAVQRWAQSINNNKSEPPSHASTPPSDSCDQDVVSVVRFLVDSVSDHPPSSSSAESEDPDTTNLEIQSLSLRLLDKWKDLKEYFKIPKKASESRRTDGSNYARPLGMDICQL